MVKSKISPVRNSIGAATSPVGISGPLMSIMTATSRPTLSETARMRRMISRVQSCLACAMLRRRTSTPDSMRRVSIFSLSVAGPSVAMILVWRKESLFMLEFEERGAAARGDDGKAATARREHGAARSLDGGGRVTVAGKVGEEHVAPARAGDAFEQFACRGVGEVSVAAADALFGTPRALGVGLEHLGAVVGLDDEDVDLAN